MIIERNLSRRSRKNSTEAPTGGELQLDVDTRSAIQVKWFPSKMKLYEPFDFFYFFTRRFKSEGLQTWSKHKVRRGSFEEKMSADLLSKRGRKRRETGRWIPPRGTNLPLLSSSEMSKAFVSSRSANSDKYANDNNFSGKRFIVRVGREDHVARLSSHWCTGEN